jgi:catechol 2,3-dioxygenase-like lactoylglutathione lyase family enzyme
MLRPWTIPALLLPLAAAAAVAKTSVAPPPPAAFPRTTIDLGTVVADLERSVRFYRDVIGFREAKGFDVPAQVATDAGLTDGKPLSIRVLVLGEGDNATKLKLMQVADTAPRPGDNEFIHSHTGFRYLTIMVADTDAALERLRAAGVKPLAKSPVAIPETIAPPGLFLTCVRDPDGNIVELIGPRAQK